MKPNLHLSKQPAVKKIEKEKKVLRMLWLSYIKANEVKHPSVLSTVKLGID